MPNIVPNQKILDIALFINYISKLGRLPRKANQLFERIKTVVQRIEISNNADIASPDYILPYAQKELYLPFSHGILNGSIVTLTYEAHEWIIRNGALSYNLTDELKPTGGTLGDLDMSRSNFSIGYGASRFMNSCMVHPDGLAVRIVTRYVDGGVNYTKGHLLLFDNTLSLTSNTELWETPYTAGNTSPDAFMNTIAVMSIEGTTMYCLNWSDGKLSTMEYNTTDKTTKYSTQVYWRHNAIDYQLTNGFIKKGSLNINPGVDFQLKRKYTNSFNPIRYGGYPFQIGFDGIHLYWNTTKIIFSLGYTGAFVNYYLSFQYVHRYKVVE